MTLAADGPNKDQITYWNEASGDKWVALQERIDAQIAVFGERVLDAAKLSAGEKVLDVGCGCGATSLDAGGRVGSAGEVVGVDISTVMLGRARERAKIDGLEQVSFVNADAQLHAFPAGHFDAVVSRFGVMFFDDPTAAFANLRGALAPNGRLVFACWRPPTENPWVMVPMQAVADILPPPDMPAPGAPGPFSLADPDRVEGILRDAGYRDITVEPDDAALVLGGGPELDVAVEFSLAMGPAGRMMQDATDAQRAQATDAVREALKPHHDANGVTLSGATWRVRASA
ncbi:MAG: class I SAM-dependent methyltransferase [Myxococcota bacterium]